MLIVTSDPENARPSEHGSAVEDPMFMELYWRQVADACRGGFGGPSFSPYTYANEFYQFWNGHGSWPYKPKFVVPPSAPATRDFAWEQDLTLPSILELLDVTGLGLPGDVTLELALQWIVETDPISTRAGLDSESESPGVGDSVFGDGVSFHILDTLVGGKMAMHALIPQDERDAAWYNARYGLDIYLRNLPFDASRWDTEWPY